MSKSGWGVLVSFAITVLSVAVPIPDRVRGYVILAAVLVLAFSGIQYLRAHRLQKNSAIISPEARFETFEPRVEYIEPKKTLGVSIGYKNVGQHDARDVDVTIWMCEQSLTLDAMARQIQSGNDIPANSPRYINVSLGITKRETNEFFIVLTISYLPAPRATTRKSQRFYFKWYGIRSGITNFSLSIANRDERSKIEQRMADDLRRLN